MASIYGGASGNGWKLRLDYTVTQDRAANTSSLRLRLYLYANTTGSYNLEKDSAYYVLQGQKVYQTYQYTVPGWYLLGERTVTVRHGADGNGTACSDGGYVKVKCGTQCSDVGGRNQVSLRVRSRRPGGEFGGYTALESDVEKVLPGFSPLLSYELELSAEDLPGSRRTVVCAIPTAAAVHLASGGTAVGVGKYAEQDRAVEVNPEWEVYVKGKPLWELIYPVGSLYLSAVDTDPGALFGGTWERIRDRFLLAAGTAYGAGTTGGEAVHTLAESELPAHAHDPANQAGYYGFITNSQKAFTVGDMGVQSGSGRYYPYAPAAFDISRNTKTGSVGGGKAHNNMPPYLAVYVWQRTA